jgi:uncharacterized membrane protein YdfJ with MMPL/SSD domain
VAQELGGARRPHRKRHEVKSVDPPVVSRDGQSVLLSIVPSHAPESDSTRNLMYDLRDLAATKPFVSKPAGDLSLNERADIDVGGNTSLPLDFATLVSNSMWKIALFIAGFSFLVLLVMLRSLVLPVKAVLMTALSVIAAYGVLVAVFQWGWFDGLFGYESPGYVEASAPPLLLAIVFGLSMDYEVFMLSRIRENVRPDRDPREAVSQGLIKSAGTITSAALIMVSVFGAFAAVGNPTVKQVGLGLAVAVALDATIVRLILVPATMQLLGAWNWWLPQSLARRLPRLSLEGEGDVPAVVTAPAGVPQPAGAPAGGGAEPARAEAVAHGGGPDGDGRTASEQFDDASSERASSSGNGDAAVADAEASSSVDAADAEAGAHSGGNGSSDGNGTSDGPVTRARERLARFVSPNGDSDSDGAGEAAAESSSAGDRDSRDAEAESATADSSERRFERNGDSDSGSVGDEGSNGNERRGLRRLLGRR